MSTYSSLKIELINTGAQTGTWGATTNTNLGTAIEEAIVGRATVDFTTDNDKTISLSDTNATQAARNFVLNVTSSVSLTATRDLIVPGIEKPYIIQNNTTGSQAIRVVVNPAQATALVNGATTSSTSLAVDTNVGTIVEGMTVTGTGITGTVTIAQVISQTSLVLSSAQTLSDNTALSFCFAVTVPNGKTAYIYNDGTNVKYAFDQTGELDVAGALSATSGTFSGAVSGTTATFTGDGTFSGTGQVKLPAGTTGQRSGSPVNGMIRYNDDLGSFEGYVAGAWGGIGGAQAGGAIMTNKDIASVSYTIATGENGLSVGPITINSGITITVSSGQTWLVL